MIQKPVKLYCFQAFFIYHAMGKTGNQIRKRTQVSLTHSNQDDCPASPRLLICTGTIVPPGLVGSFVLVRLSCQTSFAHSY